MSLQPFNSPKPSRWRKPNPSNELILAVQIEGVIRGVKLSNAYKLRQMELDMTLSLAADIMEALKTNDNPLVRPLLIQALQDWQRTAANIINGYA